jgi:O-acetyl-ADP-ribose deacetylase (regulator of RNase III)
MSQKEFRIAETKIILIKGDITEVATDAIVNAANSSLMGGGGVDGDIHRKGGAKILEECKLIRAVDWPEGLPTGKAVVTSGGDLKAKYVIHSVGPVWQGGSNHEPELLADAYRNSLELALSKTIRSIAFPSISTGAYRYPIDDASKIALTTVKGFLESKDDLDEVVFVLFTEHDFEVYGKNADQILG